MSSYDRVTVSRWVLNCYLIRSTFTMVTLRRASTLTVAFIIACVLAFFADDAAQGRDGFLRSIRIISTHLAAQHDIQTMDDSDLDSFLLAESLLPALLPELPEPDDEDAIELAEMKERLQPKRLLFVNENEQDAADKNIDTGTLQQHQFLHLHHMKTGGTSLDGLVSCGMSRLKDAKIQLKYTNLHECGEKHYADCVSGKSQQCLTGVRTAAVLSYCAPLQDLGKSFQWLPNTNNATRPATATATEQISQDPVAMVEKKAPIHAAVTVLRHPLARVWSMFRFQTKQCYDCRNLTDIYADIDQGTSQLTNMCRLQLLNHQTRNLLSAAPENEIPDSEAQAQEAIQNLKNVFTMVGLTEDMPTTAAMAAQVFPWLAESIDWNAAVGDEAHIPSDSTTLYKNCTLPHKNASPTNNHCSADRKSHWDLPDHPDEETARVIMAHNAMDLQLYEAAVAQFAMQKRALGL
jgi:hypothetical protein